MIIVEGEKYACEQCIRGHRSSTCKHINRSLVLVRSRGRPITDSNKRIAIKAGEIEHYANEVTDSVCRCSETGNRCTCSKKVKKNTVIVLKASKRQVFNVNTDSLKLLDPVMDIPSNEKGLALMNNQSKARFKSNGNVKSMKQPNHTSFIRFEGSSPQLYNNLKAKSPLKSTCCSKSATNSETPSPLNSTSRNSPLPTVGLKGNGQLFDMYYTDSCVVPGTCMCPADSCLCETCLEHHLYKDQNITTKEMFDQFHFPMDFPSENACKNITSLGHIEVQEQNITSVICECPDDACICFNCATHSIRNGVKIKKEVEELFMELTKFENELKRKSSEVSDGNSCCCSNDHKIKITATEFPIDINSAAKYETESIDSCYDNTSKVKYWADNNQFKERGKLQKTCVNESAERRSCCYKPKRVKNENSCCGVKSRPLDINEKVTANQNHSPEKVLVYEDNMGCVLSDCIQPDDSCICANCITQKLNIQ